MRISNRKTKSRKIKFDQKNLRKIEKKLKNQKIKKSRKIKKTGKVEKNWEKNEK